MNQKTGTRARQNRVEFYLNDQELAQLDLFAKLYHGDRSKTLRDLLRMHEPIAPPSVDVKHLIRELQSLGNNMNQLAAKAHTLGFVDEVAYHDNAHAVFELCGRIRETFLAGGIALGNH